LQLLRKLRNILRKMRKHRSLDALFPSVRGRVLAATVTRPDKWWYLSELAAYLHTRPSSLQRELKALVEAGILRQRYDGRRSYFGPETDSPFFQELRGLIEKTGGLAPVLQQVLEPLSDRIDVAFVYGSVARGREHALSDVDLMVVGRAGLSLLASPLRKAETVLGREINAVSYAPSEFREKLAAKDHFLSAVLRGPKEFVKGSQHDLDELARKS
jgi:predicted nucleotidyltransferase